ncbi:GNAT family N-acetyltransferase [Actinomadura rupiterrae]|uniref:GNAT family N-acetyltransferase n=1 Tax=Actinomadura rupiterrae TaxID=559627 RepID=UPI0020A37182|nr:GNAT family protein [Actinomadura rupiterrae]MCP2341194.1 RimJ/RimL family protein N-acetyltransferase [Actinomadura rupiterrae]
MSTERPPERIDLPELTLRRAVEDDAANLMKAVNDSFEHLQPWMPWATEKRTVQEELAWIASCRAEWESGLGYAYLLENPDGDVVGTAALHNRIGPGVLEIGYWVHAGHTRRGHATRAAGALTGAAFGMEGVERVEIHCDVANKRSAAVPPKLGYELLVIEDDVRTAPAEEGPRMRWGITRAAWERRA